MKQLIRTVCIAVIILAHIGFNQSFAQTASSYVYSFTKPNYVAITGTSLVTGTSSWNSGLVFTNVPIGFTFYFEGQPYTTVGVSSNGFIWFGPGTVSTTEYNPISDATLGTGTITGVASGYGTQFDAFPNNLSDQPSGTPEISYTTTGSGCSQIFTVQWKGGYAAANPAGTLDGDENRVDIQIVLYQGTNEIGLFPHVNPYPYLFGSSSGEVGIRGASNTDFSSLTGWGAASDQTTNNTAMGTLNPSYPPTKSEYSFTPPACLYTSVTSSTNPTCGANGTITITPTGTGPYTYIIDNGITSDTNQTGLFTGLAAGSYTTTVTNGTCAIISCATLTSSVITPTANNSGAVCVGGTVTLMTTAVNGATYSWTGPNGFASSQQNPVITNASSADSGTYTIIDTVGGCTSGPGTTKVVINPTPSTPKVSSNSPLCTGGTLTLVDSTSATTYSWTGPNSFISAQQDPTIANVTTADSGIYTITNTVSGCTSAPATVHVTISSALPAPKVGSNSPLCAGSTLTLSDSTSGATYSWTGPNSFASGNQNPTIPNVVAADSGTYTVINTVSGCSSLPATVHVSVSNISAAPKVASNSPVCAGTVLNLNDSTSGAKYGWTGPNGFTSNNQNPSIPAVVFADSGTYTVVDTISGCVSLPATVHVSVNAVPATPKLSSNSPVCVGTTLTLSDSTGGVSYAWTGPNTFISSLQNPTIPGVILSDSGTYSVINTVAGCSSTPGTVHVAVNPIPSTPVANGGGPYCTGDSIKLTASTIVNAIYNWTGPNTFTSQNPVKPNAAKSDSGTYTVIATVNGCNSAPASANVIVNQTPATPGTGYTGPYCVGDTMKLTASSGTGAIYNWTGPNDFSNQQFPQKDNVTLSDSGVYTVVATIGNCSSAPATVHVVVAPPPPAPQPSYNSPVCEGSPLNLSALNITGASFNWTGPNNFTNQQNPGKPNASYADSGVYTVVATIGNCSSPPATIDVAIDYTPTLSAAFTNSPVCSGDTLRLTAQSVNGVTYNWTGTGGFSSNQPNVTLANSAIADSGLYIISVTLGNCTSIPDSFRVIINALPASPTVSASRDTICISDTAQVCVSGTFDHYQWNTVLQGNSGDTTQCIYVLNAGDYYLTVTDTNGCSTTSTPHLQVYTYPATSVSIVVQGDTLSSFGATSYQWILNDTDIAGANSSIYIAKRTGNYSVRIVDHNGCISTSSSTYVVVNGIADIISTRYLDIYPNPASTILNVRYSGPVEGNCTLALFDILGNKLMEQPLYFNVAGNRQLDVSYLPRGMYLLQLQTADQFVTEKIAIQ